MSGSRDDVSESDETYVIVDEEPGSERRKKPEPVRAEEASVSPLDRGFLYGDAVFETLRCYGSSPAFLSRHIHRLNSALDEVGIPASFTEDDLESRIRRLLGRIHDDAGYETDTYVRVSVTRGERRGLLSPTETSPTLVAVAKALDGSRRYPPADIEVVEETRPVSSLGSLKTHNYLPNILAKSETETDEALMLDGSGCVASGAVSNVFFFDSDGVLVTPGTRIRKGVTREVVLETAGSLGIEVREKNPRRDAVDEYVSGFLTNSTWGVRRISSIDGESLEVIGALEDLRDEYIERATSCGSVFD
ncbi:MAG: aminotransferase class IV [Halobacteria archaeon]|nr:aminotransferase class IV [Halobacteria archaeon]